jgi:hypothetical protein
VRLLLSLLCLAVLVTAAARAAPARTSSLTITYWPDGPSGTKRTWIVSCNGLARGTWPRRVEACRSLAKPNSRAAFAPVPADAICTEIYGGPDLALVTGNIQGRKVWARFSRQNGCHISRWERLVKLGLLPSAAA